MFDFFDTSKLLIIGVVALLVIPPKDLPSVLRQVGQAVGKLRRMAADFQNQFKDELAEAEIDTLKKDLQAVTDSAKVDLDNIIGHTTVDAAPAQTILDTAPAASDMLGEVQPKPKKKRAAPTADLPTSHTLAAESPATPAVKRKAPAKSKPTVTAAKRTVKADV